MKMTIQIENMQVLIDDNTPPVFIKIAMKALEARKEANA